uniref:Uncharacterized protein n=1 Tax=Glossina brevipalpis TaxID=37001 RepID=A0A1A9WI60_9MUSC
MDSSHHVTVPLRYGIKKMRKRRDLDALLAQSHQKTGTLRRCNATRVGGSGVYSQDKLLNAASTDDQEDYNWQPKVKQPSHHCGHNKQTILRLYIIILFIVILMIFVGFTYWLNFNLQQQIYEYRQKVEQVSATSQLLPDTLQAWHETSTALIKNQSLIVSKISDLQHSVQELWKNFTEYRLSMEAQKSYEKEEKLVADFGAKIEAIATDVESMKDRYNGISQKQENLQTVFNNLKASNVSFINDTLTQKSIMMQEELVKHKNKLDELFDRSANITSHVTSLENSWPEYKQKVLNFSNIIPRLEKEITKLNGNSQKLDVTLQNICKECQNSYIETLQRQQRQQHNINDNNNFVETIAIKTTTSTLRPESTV